LIFNKRLLDFKDLEYYFKRFIRNKIDLIIINEIIDKDNKIINIINGN
jgi:hypothetical protein